MGMGGGSANAGCVTQRCCRCGTRAGRRASLARSRQRGCEVCVRGQFFDVGLMASQCVEAGDRVRCGRLWDDPDASAAAGRVPLGEEMMCSEIDNKSR
jgi:hypothetical protein